ncbi:MAG: flagellar hook-length control protein FliK, partial [Bacillota bacterium]
MSAARGGGPGATASSGTGPVGAVQEPGGDGSTGLPAYAQPQPVAASDPGAPAAPAASRASVMQQLAGHLQEMVAEMRQEITAGGVGRVAIRLHPEYLGQVVLRISIDRSGTVTAQFAVENPQVRAWIEEELPQLRAALAEHGLQLADANVDSGPG